MRQLIRTIQRPTPTHTLDNNDRNSDNSQHDVSALVVGLGSHAFLILSKNAKQHQKQQQQLLHVVLLLPPYSPPPPTKTKTKSKTKSKTDETATTKEDPLLEILAVTTFSDPLNQSTTTSTFGTFWCAVARANKSLAIYRVDPTLLLHLPNDGISTKATIDLAPITVHHTAKRVGCLAFGQIPKANDTANEQQQQQPEEQPLVVLIAGDLVGDVTAYRIEECDAVASTTAMAPATIATTNEDEKNGNHMSADEEAKDNPDNDDDNDDDDEDDDETASRNKRLMLGHTASMLTALCLLDQHNLILTADRDEKIRVSAFPNTHLIHGFLLGHTAFVASMDVMLEDSSQNQHPEQTPQMHQQTLCVSVGGDSTLRLWNVTTCEEIACIAAPFGSDNDGVALVPSRVAVDNTTVVVLYDQSARVDIFEITAHSNVNSNQGVDSDVQQKHRYGLQWIQTLQCPAAPLSVVATRGCTSQLSIPPLDQSTLTSFWLLCREPDYLLKLDVTKNSTGAPTVHWNDTDSMIVALRNALVNTAAAATTKATTNVAAAALDKDDAGVDDGNDTSASIIMPASLWERDTSGQLTVIKVHDKRHDGTDAQQTLPWNRVGRVEKARQRNLRHKKRRQEKSEARYRQKQQAKLQQKEEENTTTS